MKMIFAVVLLAFVASPVFSDESLSPDEQVQFVRGLAHFNEAGDVEGQITAWVYEHEQRPGAKSAFAKLIGVDLDTLTEQEAALFDYRTQLFRFDSESGKRLRLQWADGRQLSLPLTDADGISSYHVRLGPLADLAIRKTATTAAVLDFQVVLPDEDKRQFTGQLLLVPNAGLSVVSDTQPDPGNTPPAERPSEPLALGRHLALSSCGECHGRTLEGWEGDSVPSLVAVSHGQRKVCRNVR